MRVYTLAFSIVLHLAVVPLIVIATLTATDTLPAPRRTSVFVQVMAPPVPAPPPMPPIARTVAVPAADAAPLVAPDGVQPETIDTTFVDTFAGAGVFGVVPGSEVAWSEPEPPPPLAAQAVQPVRVGGAIRPPRKIKDAAPVYPPIAMAARVEGIVILEALIGADGAVDDVRVVRSYPLLDGAAIEAVRQWRYTPTFLNEQPVPVLMTVTVSFVLR